MTLLRRYIATILALSLVLLPFSVSFGYYLPAEHSAMASDHGVSAVECAADLESHGCDSQPGHSAGTDVDEDCCVARCDLHSVDKISHACNVNHTLSKVAKLIDAQPLFIPDSPTELLLRPPRHLL